MRTIKIEKIMCWEDAAKWIRDNRDELMNYSKSIEIDLSGILMVPNNFLGFIVNLIYQRKKHNLKTKVKAPQAGFMSGIFNEIDTVFNINTTLQ